MEWIDIKKKLPPYDNNGNGEYCLAFHTRYGVGVAWFNKFEDGEKEEMEEDFDDEYICSCHFIKNKLDGNDCIDDETDIDIFMRSPHFTNLGTVTHWMPLPANVTDLFQYS